MFSVITNICNKKTKGSTIKKGSTLMELFTATVPPPLEMFDVCTTGDTAHIDTIFKSLPHMPQHDDACVSKKTFFSFPLAVNNSIKIGPFVFLL